MANHVYTIRIYIFTLLNKQIINLRILDVLYLNTLRDINAKKINNGSGTWNRGLNKLAKGRL